MKATAPALRDPAMRTGLTPAQKAALVLASLPRETASAIVAEIDDKHLAAVVRAISDMKSSTPQARQLVVQEFIADVLRRRDELPGGPSQANRLLSEIADKARVERVMGAMTGPNASPEDLWRAVAALPAERIAAFLAGQRQQTAAAVLMNLPAPTAAGVLAVAQIDLSRRLTAILARMERPDAATAEAMARAVERELLKMPSAESAAVEASGSIVDIFDLLPAALRDGLIDYIGSADEAMAAAIRNTLLTFQVLPARLTETAVAALVRTADRAVLMRALKHGEANAAATNEFLMANMSKRMAEELREELAGLAAPEEAEGEAAQRAVVAAVKALEKSGEIKLRSVK